MGKIDKIKIGGIIFTVVRVHDLKHSSDNRRLDGNIVYGESKIYLDDDLNGQAETQTIWHEVVHGILVHAGMTEVAGKEELIEAISYGIMMVLYDNPQLANVKP